MDGQRLRLCGACDEEKFEANPRFAITGDETTYVCEECSVEYILPQFQSALQFEHHYPPEWAMQAISVEPFANLLGQDFVDRYHAREVEYHTPPADRVYCPIPIGGEVGRCNGFVGSRGNATQLCPQCGAGVCTNCEQVMLLETGHDCPQRPVEAPEATDAFAFNGVERGVEWQECPVCQLKVLRDEGCNEMTCRCNTHFCYLCGQNVPPEERHTHWTRAAGCQRYGDAAHPIEDPEDAFDWVGGEEDPDDWFVPQARLQDQMNAAIAERNNMNDFPGATEAAGDEDHETGSMITRAFEIVFGRVATPDSDNDFLGAAEAASDGDDVPGIGMMSRAFDVVHNLGAAPLAERLLDHDSVIVVQRMRNDRTTIHQAINQLMVPLHEIWHPPAGQAVDLEQARDYQNAINMLHALHALLNVLISAFTNNDVVLNDLAGALRFARFDVRWLSHVTLSDILPPGVDDIQFIREGEVDQVLEFIERQQRSRMLPAVSHPLPVLPADDDDQAEEATRDDGPAPPAP